MKINFMLKANKTRLLESDHMNIENMDLPQNSEMEEEYLDDELLEKIERGFKRSNQSLKAEQVHMLESSMYEEYPETKPIIPKQPHTEVPLVIRGYHEGFSCNVCRREIYGFRYVCMQCADWDMCAACEARSEHPAHYVLRIPAPKPYAEVQFAIDIIRREFVEKSPGEIRIKKEVVEDVFLDHMVGAVKSPAFTKNIPQNYQKQRLKPDKAKPVVNEPIIKPTNEAIVKPILKSKPKNLTQKAKDFPMVHPTNPLLKVAKMSSLQAVPTASFKNVQNKMSPVRKKPEQNMKKVKPIMLKFKVPPGMDSKHILRSLKSGLRVNLDRLPEEVVTQTTSKR